MKKFLIKNFNLISIVPLALFLFLLISPVLAQTTESYNFVSESGLNQSAVQAGYETGSNATSINSLIGLIINIVLSLVGVVFLAFTIYAGMIWMTARGNEQKVDKASTILRGSLIGLIIVLGAYAVSYFLISRLFSN